MRTQHQVSFLLLATLLVVTFGAVRVESAEFFLSPDSVIRTGAVGTKVDLELRVDAAMQDLKIYQITFKFDPAKLDVDSVEVTQGPLMPSAGQTAFHWFLENDDSLLTIEDLILRAGKAVDGPGVLAYIRLHVTDTGRVDLAVHRHRARDINGDTLFSDASGAILLLDYPPLPFNLLLPVSAGSFNGTKCPGDSITFAWEPARSVYPAETVSYTLEMSRYTAFLPEFTTTLSGLSDTTARLPANELVTAPRFWRVRAVGNIVGAERESSPYPLSFTFIQGPDLDDDGWGAACDCNDTDSLIHPNTIWYEDADGDLYGNSAVTITQCEQPQGFVLDGSDCDDTDNRINPETAWHEDVDEDGYGHPDITLTQCEEPLGYVLDGTDNCPNVFNPDQADGDGNGIGDACDCSCPFHADMDEIGGINSVDLAVLIDAVFFGGEDPHDSRCPNSRGDFNCDGASDSIDLSLMIDHVFFGAAPACDPCL